MAYFGFKDLSSLSTVDMTIYRYVTQNVDKVIYMRVRDIAQSSHVSNSSVMRFIHKIGFNSFPEFKAYLKNNHLSFQPQSNKMNFIDASNFPKDIETKIMLVANKIYQSDNITTLGMGNSGYLAEYAARTMAALGFNTTAITEPFYPLRAKLKNTSNNIIMCYSVSGETSELIELINEFVNDEDVTIVCITSNESSTIAKMSRYVLSYINETHYSSNHYNLTSQIPVMYLIENLDKTLENLMQQ
ncbi:MAG: MurR/RpiR family transcriptional regulator [Lactobacillus sp.]|nr:MurR/RpiR family transcriptional regulator [Lactobacillus sp.]